MAVMEDIVSEPSNIVGVSSTGECVCVCVCVCVSVCVCVCIQLCVCENVCI